MRDDARSVRMIVVHRDWRIEQPTGRSRGFTLVELMVALTIGLLMLGALVTVFANSSSAHAELAKASEHTQNGATATRLLSEDLAHAAYYGEFYQLPPPGATAPDPCSFAVADLYSGLAFPIHGYDAPTASPLACLGNNDYVPGTDVVVVRRADVSALAVGAVASASEVYLQANPFSADVQFGAGSGISPTSKADGMPAEIFKRDGITAAEIRKYIVNIYFIAPCSVPANGTSSCTGAGDDGGTPIPTLKRLELTTVSGSTAWRIVPLVEGVQDLQLDYGVDNSPIDASAITGWPGDGAPDVFMTAPTAVEWPHVVSVNVRLLARSTLPTPGHVDAKSYDMGLAGVRVPLNDAYRRHVFANAVRVHNVSGRREIPQ